ncbi:putative TIM-barrel fold metal-dependent hydrolase [Saccharothrix tamanrassetensis]|uniref:Putative TIM-barrel fold metal-dependent hydrolase n=1 Tax=Saccharothrix tamanrassetensis TaxID=1051531 RepID=A0A841CRM1_9PSEU|nr:amidohydrolase family protein [Saccharothrix tamanrassetensis]MBB5959523.1 putative TIM-barrel fold metal-dependent hydrolase [Saccharothrix tamanrassetensis]
MDWIDVHHHAYHGRLADALAARGVTHMAPGVPVPRWEVGDTFRVMDDCGLDAAVLSVLVPDAALRLPDAADLVRRTNEWTAELVRAHPHRLGLLATLPLPDLGTSLAEVGHAFDVLDADGVVLPASLADGALLGDPRLDPLLAELDRRGAVAFVHPNPGYRCSCTGAPDSAAAVPPPLVDFVMDTTRAVANLLFRGALRRFPGIRFVLAHGGGTIPYLAGRLELAKTWVLAPQEGQTQQGQTQKGQPQNGQAQGASAQDESAQDGSAQDAQVRADSVYAELGRLYYETAQASSRGALACVDTVAEPGHVLFGTDFPFMTAPVVAATRREVAAHRADIGGAGLALFPRLRTGTRR